MQNRENSTQTGSGYPVDKPKAGLLYRQRVMPTQDGQTLII